MKLGERIAAMFRRKTSPRITLASIVGPSETVAAITRRACKAMMRNPETRELCRVFPELTYEAWRATFGEHLASHPAMRPSLEQVARLGVNQEAVLNLFFREIRRAVVS